jgi:hypothetical protein
MEDILQLLQANYILKFSLYKPTLKYTNKYIVKAGVFLQLKLLLTGSEKIVIYGNYIVVIWLLNI